MGAGRVVAITLGRIGPLWLACAAGAVATSQWDQIALGALRLGPARLVTQRGAKERALQAVQFIGQAQWPADRYDLHLS